MSTGHASRRAQPATGAWCPCGRPIRWCCPQPINALLCNKPIALLVECCACRLERLAAETARIVGEGAGG